MVGKETFLPISEREVKTIAGAGEGKSLPAKNRYEQPLINFPCVAISIVKRSTRTNYEVSQSLAANLRSFLCNMHTYVRIIDRVDACKGSRYRNGRSSIDGSCICHCYERSCIASRYTIYRSKALLDKYTFIKD